MFDLKRRTLSWRRVDCWKIKLSWLSQGSLVKDRWWEKGWEQKWTDQTDKNGPFWNNDRFWIFVTCSLASLYNCSRESSANVAVCPKAAKLDEYFYAFTGTFKMGWGNYINILYIKTIVIPLQYLIILIWFMSTHSNHNTHEISALSRKPCRHHSPAASWLSLTWSSTNRLWLWVQE